MFWVRGRKWELRAPVNRGEKAEVRVCAQMDGPGAASAPMIHYSPFISQCWMVFPIFTRSPTDVRLGKQKC